MSDYRGDLYRKIVLDFYKQKHRPPYVEELKSLGVKELYFKKKYGLVLRQEKVPVKLRFLY